MAYAENTSVPVDRSKAEVERTLSKYGAVRFGVMNEVDGATVYFEHHARQIQLRVPMPPKKEAERDERWQKEYRRRWRVMVITIKAMLEAVESKVLTFDQAFLPFIVIPGTAQTLGEAIVPKLDALYQGQSLPALLAENPRPKREP